MLRQRAHKAAVHEVTTQILPILVEIPVHHNY